MDLKLDPARLDALAVTARTAKATLSGRVDHTHSLRDQRHGLRQQISLVNNSASASAVARAEAPEKLAALERQVGELASRIEVAEIEETEAATAAHAARANLEAAVDHATGLGWTVPAAVQEVAQW